MPPISFTSAPDNIRQRLDINYANDDKVYHNLDIYLPQTDKPVYKAVIVIYGSAWLANNMKQIGFQILGKPLLDAGFAVVAINHRSSADAAYPAQINDVKAAIRFIRANAGQYNIDASFIGITGFSSGGHLAALAGSTNGIKQYTVGNATVDMEGEVGNFTTTSSAVNAVVDWFGPVDFTRFKDCKAPNDDKSPEAALIKGNPTDNLDMLALLSPLTFIEKDDPKFLVIHGDADNVVPCCQSRFFADALKAKGLLDELIIVPNGQHGPGTFNKITCKKMADFFVKSACK